MAVVHEFRDFIHSMVHRAKIHQITDASPTLSNGASMGLVFWTSGSDLHTVFGVAGGGRGRVRLYEDPTVTASTLCLCACSMNREKRTSASIAASFGHTPAFTVASASLLSDQVIPGTTGGNKCGGTLRVGTEWVFDEDTKYIIAACNLSGGDAAFSITAECYEY